MSLTFAVHHRALCHYQTLKMVLSHQTYSPFNYQNGNVESAKLLIQLSSS